LSAIAPANGCVRPQNSWPNANARLMLPSPSPVAVLSGPRNKPIDWRVPIVSAKVPAAASFVPFCAFARQRTWPAAQTIALAT